MHVIILRVTDCACQWCVIVLYVFSLCLQFVDENIPWAHLDIAGPVWSTEKKGATGFAVATLVHWVQKHSSS